MTHQKKNMTIESITKNIKANIQNSLYQFDIKLSKKDLNLSPPKQESFGDLSSNIALILAKQIKRNPLEIAGKVCKDLINIKTRQYAKRQNTWARGHMKNWNKLYSKNFSNLLKKTSKVVS